MKTRRFDMFHVGQKVVCVKEDNKSDFVGIEDPTIWPKVGEECLIIGFDEILYLELEGYRDGFTYNPDCFRPLTEFGESITDKIEKEINETIEV